MLSVLIVCSIFKWSINNGFILHSINTKKSVPPSQPTPLTFSLTSGNRGVYIAFLSEWLISIFFLFLVLDLAASVIGGGQAGLGRAIGFRWWPPSRSMSPTAYLIT